MLDLSARLGPLCTRPRFLRVDEIDAEGRGLAERFEGTVGVETIGAARSGHPLQMLTVGSGGRHAFVFGMTHPNEPTGALAALSLVELLAADGAAREALGLTWHVVPCCDPDGTRLNEAWFGGPYDRATYARHFYRPPAHEQVEWTFHLAEREPPGLSPVPESRALMDAFDAVGPELLVSMHNGEAGGLFCYVTDAEPDLAAEMAGVLAATGLPAEHGEPEGPVDVRSPGVFLSPPQDGAPMICTTDYAARRGAFAIMTEPPLWADGRAADMRPAGFTRAEAHARTARRRAELVEEHAAWVAALDGRLTLSTPLHRAVRDDADLLRNGAPLGEPGGADERPATVAYACSLGGHLHLQRLRAAGHLAGVLRAELDAGNDDAELGRTLVAVERRIVEWGEQADDVSAPFVGTSAAVEAHVGLALASAAALR